MIKRVNLDASLQSLVFGMQIGNVYFLDGTSGSNTANGKDQTHAVKTLAQAIKMTTSGHHDYILAFGAETGTAAVEISQKYLHIIGIGTGGVLNEHARGFNYTCAATVDTLQPTAAADYIEIAGIRWVCSATDHILIDDAGCTGASFHHNTVYGSGTASNAIRLDIEGDQWSICDNVFWQCKLAIDLAEADCVVARNIITDQDTAAKGLVVGANSHRTLVIGNIFNLSGTTGDVGLTIASSADYCVVKDNYFNSALSDAISDAGTSTMLIANYSSAITGTSGASLVLAINN
jgi:hypothetical protein